MKKYGEFVDTILLQILVEEMTLRGSKILIMAI